MKRFLLIVLLVFCNVPLVFHSNLDASFAIPPNIIIIGTGRCEQVVLAHELYHLYQFRNPSYWYDLALFWFDQYAHFRIESEANEFAFPFNVYCSTNKPRDSQESAIAPR